MKTTNLILTVIFSLGLSLSLFANGDHDPNASVAFEAAIQPTHNDAIIFRCTNNVYDKLFVKVYDEQGTMLHSKLINTKGNIKLTYKTSELPYGEFTIKVYHKFKKVYGQTFNLNEKSEVEIVLD